MFGGREGGEWTSLIVIAAFPYDLHSLDRAPGIAIVQTARRHPLRRTRILARSGFGNLDLILNRIAQQKSISSLEREGQRKEKEGVAIARSGSWSWHRSLRRRFDVRVFVTRCVIMMLYRK